MLFSLTPNVRMLFTTPNVLDALHARVGCSSHYALWGAHVDNDNAASGSTKFACP
jgi:hypothetical protein